VVVVAVSERSIVAMFVRNTFHHDARVTKEATALIDEGVDVVVFAVAIDPAEVGESQQGPIRVIRQTLPSAVWKLVSLVAAFIREYAKLLNIAKRILRRATGRSAPPSTKGGTPATPARSVAAANAARWRLRDFLTPAHRFLQGIRYARVAGEQAAALKPVVYHCHDLNSILAGFRARRLHPAPVIYDAHELWPHRNRPDARRRKTWVMEKADRYCSRHADGVITVNESIARHMEKRYGLPEVVVIRNIPALAARDEPPPFAVLDDLPRPRLVYVGGIQTNRGIEQVIDALPQIEGAVFFAVGPGDDSYRAALERRAAEHGVAGRVRFLPRVPIASVVRTVTQGDLGMCLFQGGYLSYYWTLPNKFFEYIHAGVPVLASDFPETRRLVDRYEIGAVCDPGDPADIAAKVNDLLSRPDDLARMRDNTTKAAQELNWELEQKHLVALYRRLVPGVFD
jgi:glycosyltransferase involved in cell wall biosynthesis